VVIGLIALILVIGLGQPLADSKQKQPSQAPGKSPSLDALKRGYLASERGEHAEAHTHFLTALDLASTSELRFQAYVGLGSADAALGRLDDARQNFDRALEIKPDNAATLFSLGLVAKRQGKLQEAATFFASAAVRDPSLGEALVELGVVYEILGRHQEAADACWRAVSVLPRDEGALLCLGVARYHLGLYEGAEQAFAAVVEQNPGSPRARYGLGLCRLYQDDLEGAMLEYRALKPLDPELASDLLSRMYPPE
jgi:tetratricopeptide (TPR) repeat protein